MIERHGGTLINWDKARKFGFIQSGKREVFAHISDFPPGAKPKVGDSLTFTQIMTEKGFRATEIHGSRIKKRPVHSVWKNLYFTIALVSVAVGIFILFRDHELLDSGRFQASMAYHSFLSIPSIYLVMIPFTYIVTSLITLKLYHSDKNSALLDEWRVPESTLHLFELFGGWIGGFFAQKIWRHKSSKGSYQFVFWTIVTLHLLVWIDLIFFNFQGLQVIYQEVAAYL